MKPTITVEQVKAIEGYLKMPFYNGDKSKLIISHADLETQWEKHCLNRLSMDTLCRYLYAPDTVAVVMS